MRAHSSIIHRSIILQSSISATFRLILSGDLRIWPTAQTLMPQRHGAIRGDLLLRKLPDGFHKMLAPETLIPGSTIAAQVAVRRLGDAAGPAGQLFPAGAAAPSRRVRAGKCARSARRLDIHARRWACVADAFAVGAAEKALPLQTQALLCLQGGARFEHITTLKPVYCRRHVGPRGRAAEPGVRRLHSARHSLRRRQPAGLAG